jgi:hypothetical protein
MTEGASTTVSVVAVVIAFLALGISALTAWLTLLRKGALRMTQPTQIYFGPDGGFKRGEAPSKVYLRAMLFATGKRGRIIENMFARLQRGETRQNFNIWVHGDNDNLRRGAGLFVSEIGVVTNHHFVIPPDATFEFISGKYLLEVFATEVGRSRAWQLFSISLEIPPTISDQLRNPDNGLYFDWGPDSQQYMAHIRMSPRSEVPAFLREIFKDTRLRGEPC